MTRSHGNVPKLGGAQGKDGRSDRPSDRLSVASDSGSSKEDSSRGSSKEDSKEGQVKTQVQGKVKKTHVLPPGKTPHDTNSVII